MGRRLIVLVIVVMLVTIGIWACFLHVKGRSDSVSVSSSYEGDSSCRNMYRYISPTKEEIGRYGCIVEEIVSAYSNRQYEAMIDCFKRLPKSLFALRGNDRLDVVRPLIRIWLDEVVISQPSDCYTSAEDFERKMRTEMTLACVLGNYNVSSGMVAGTIMISIDQVVLERLQRFNVLFENSGRVECLHVSQKLIEDWIGRIEDENGFTRVCMREQSRRFESLIKSGEMSSESARETVRGFAEPLRRRCGYVPKWLDEEFPLLTVKGSESKFR